MEGVMRCRAALASQVMRRPSPGAGPGGPCVIAVAVVSYTTRGHQTQVARHVGEFADVVEVAVDDHVLSEQGVEDIALGREEVAIRALGFLKVTVARLERSESLSIQNSRVR